MKPLSENFRYEYFLTPHSWIVDAGAYHGDFSREMTKRYDCNIIGFEPIFWWKASADQADKVMISSHALGGSSRKELFSVSEDSTGLFCETDTRTPVRILDVYFLAGILPRIDLLKLNIEGMEYEVLERILEKQMQPAIDNIQVQFHPNVPNYFARRENIQVRLSETHELTYCEDFVWENWSRK